MSSEDQQIGHSAAQRMLDAFASVGATNFDVTWTSIAGEKEWFRRAMTYADLARTLPAMLDAAPAKQRNVIVRPHGPTVSFIQLDDTKSETMVRLAPAVFLALEPSPGNFQAWVALDGRDDKDFARRLRKGAGADDTAGGATRVASSLNFKEKYAPNFPRVAVAAVQTGRKTSVAELEGFGVVSPPEAAARPAVAPRRSYASSGRRRWPSYARCVEGAPLNHGGAGPDVSRADFVWCMTAISWGWSVADTAAQLVEESEKARANGESYAALTARNAAAAVERGQRPASAVPAPTPGGRA